MHMYHLINKKYYIILNLFIQALEVKIQKLEELVKLKDSKIDGLKKKL